MRERNRGGELARKQASKRKGMKEARPAGRQHDGRGCLGSQQVPACMTGASMTGGSQGQQVPGNPTRENPTRQGGDSNAAGSIPMHVVSSRPWLFSQNWGRPLPEKGNKTGWFKSLPADPQCIHASFHLVAQFFTILFSITIDRWPDISPEE